MKKSYYVECHLAQQLKEECQALALKKVMIDGIRNKLAKEKLQFIEKRLGGHTFRFASEVWVFLGVIEDHYDDTMYFHITFGRLPENVVSPRVKLTKEEKNLLNIYRTKIDELKHSYWKTKANDASNAACQLRQLKHHYSLIGSWAWDYSFEDALFENFYNQTGMYYEDDNGNVKLIEECIVDN